MRHVKHPWRGEIAAAVKLKRRKQGLTHFECRECNGVQPGFYQSACGHCGSLSLVEQAGRVEDRFIGESNEALVELPQQIRLSMSEVKERLRWDRAVGHE